VRLEDIIRLSPAQRRRLRLCGPPRHYRKERRKRYAADELVDHLRRGSIRSTRVLERLRRSGDPTTYDFRREFGSWRKAVEAAFGKSPFLPTVDLKYVLRSAVLYNVRTYRDYIGVRRSKPEVFPSIRFVRKEFSSFAKFALCVRGESLERTAEDYGVLWRKLGRRPLVEDCKTAGIMLDMPMKVFQSKAKFDDFVEGLNRVGDRMRGTS